MQRAMQRCHLLRRRGFGRVGATRPIRKLLRISEEMSVAIARVRRDLEGQPGGGLRRLGKTRARARYGERAKKSVTAGQHDFTGHFDVYRFNTITVSDGSRSAGRRSSVAPLT